MAARVEADQRHHHQRQRVRIEQAGGGCVGFGDAVAVGGQRIARAPGREAQALVGAEHGQAIHQAGREVQLPGMQADLAIHRPIAGDVALCGQPGQGEQAAGQRLRTGDAGGGRQCTTAFAQAATQGGAVVGEGAHAVCGPGWS